MPEERQVKRDREREGVGERVALKGEREEKG